VARGELVPALPGWRAKTDGSVHFVYPALKRRSANVRAFVEAALSVIEVADFQL